MLTDYSPTLLQDFMVKAGFGPAIFTGGEARSYSRRAAEIVFIFSSDDDLLQSEEWLEKSGLDFGLIPTPREASDRSASLALAFDAPGRRCEYLAALSQVGVRPSEVYLRRGYHFTRLEWAATGANA